MPPETGITEAVQNGRRDAAVDLRALSDSVGSPVGTTPVAPTRAPFWKPTMADFLFVSLIIWLFLAGPNGWVALLSDGDTGWHIRIGDWILDHHAFPRTDFMSFSKAGEAWYAWEWGAEVVMSWLHTWAGMKGVVLGLGILIPAYLLIVFRHAMWRGWWHCRFC
jgi:hypothetical protein